MFYAMLFWVGYNFNAPAWYWWVWGIGVALKVLTFGIEMYNKGKDGK